MTTPDAVLTGLADGLRRRVTERDAAEERLADFVFREGSKDAGRPTLAESDWRYFISRTLATAGEPGTLDLLERLSSGEETVRSLGLDRADGTGGLPGGLATIDRIGGLAAAGLAGRDLETGRVALTGLGSAVLAFTREWGRRAAEPAPADDRGAR